MVESKTRNKGNTSYNANSLHKYNKAKFLGSEKVEAKATAKKPTGPKLPANVKPEGE
jgi:hypothetical protein